MTSPEMKIEDYQILEKPYYLEIHDEAEVFRAAYRARIPVLLKGPTGTGKTRFVEYMAYILGLEKADSSGKKPSSLPLVTVACHEDLTATDLVGKYLLKGDETLWMDGPLTLAVKTGAICYLDEIVEARKDTTVIIHPLSDHRRILPVDKKGTVIQAHEDFFLVISYNPGYQSAMKNLKHSTRQRFISIEFDYPSEALEAAIIAHESGIDESTALDLAKLGAKIRNLNAHVLSEAASTRLLIYAGELIQQGIDPKRACEIAVVSATSDEKQVQRAIAEVVSIIF
ncbi:MAG: CbbQ/NirQ/NorQ/GpvN family protein [Desulfobacteraceae bacterium]|nr:CbbQ/NirQ/NorQ/GpvN family protein [Desulfobacteraceae bacterium]MBU4052972.1 CbbQ/NirQ/NorQ/GpvN family protein [Pseudomonadota bacterium]